jgi:hypothetical protein
MCSNVTLLKHAAGGLDLPQSTAKTQKDYNNGDGTWGMVRLGSQMHNFSKRIAR